MTISDIAATAAECRLNAQCMQQQAEAALDLESKDEYEKLAKEWLAKATELENDLA